MRARFLLLLALVAGCADSRSTDALLDAAMEADTGGRSREAAPLYRHAAHRGDAGAAMWLADRGVEKNTLDEWLFDPRPTHAEARWWEARLRGQAARQIAAGDTSGHLMLGRLALFHVQTFQGVDRDSAGVARRHFDTAARLGSREAIRDRAMLVWMTDGLLAAEPYFRQGARAGFVQSAVLASMAISDRPRIERGVSVNDAVGNPALMDVVGSIRYLHGAGFAETTAQAEVVIEGYRAQARTGDAVADSIARAFDQPQPSVSS